MKSIGLLVAALVFTGCTRISGPPTVTLPPSAKQMVFQAADGQTVYADYYATAYNPPLGVVLMFHQAGSNAGEYATIAPQVAALGLDCLAVDARSGGDMFDRQNRTAGTATGDKDYLHAYNDLVGAVQWAQKKGYKRILPWGSSYSASLTLRLLGDYPKLTAGLVFSPGEYFDDKSIVASWAAKVKQPVFFACTADELQDGRKEIFNALGSAKISTGPISLPGAVHGSSTCIDSKSSAAGQYMVDAEKFIEKALKSGT